MAAALLLKGSAGTGKTLLAQKYLQVRVSLYQSWRKHSQETQPWRERFGGARALGERSSKQALRCLSR